MHRIKPLGMVRPPYYRKVYKDKIKLKPESWMREEFVNLGDEDESGSRLWDYYKTGELIKQMPKIMERIEFVSPFEREWKRFETKWHKGWMAPLVETRKAWLLQPVPGYFDVLNFYKYITKTRVVDGDESVLTFDEFYKSVVPSSTAINVFEDRIKESLLCHLQLQNNDEENVTELLRQIIEDAALAICLAHNDLKLMSRRISHTSRCESFWIRAGFTKMNKHQQIWNNEEIARKTRFPCDDRRRLGELAFTMRDKMAVQIRGLEPLQNIFDFADTEKLEVSVFEESIDVDNEVIMNPSIFNLWPDKEILYQAPGFDADVDEPQKYGRLAVKNVSDIFERIRYWNPESKAEASEMGKEMFTAVAVSSLFNWLNAQAHVLGYTQFTDIEIPLTSQIILSNGKEFFFAIGQLNTIAINVDVKGFVNKSTNVCYVDGPYTLFEEFDEQTGNFKSKNEHGKLVDGLNKTVLQRILQMFWI